MQVVIPDLDDKELFAPPSRRFHSPAGSRSGSSLTGDAVTDGPASSQQLQSAVGSANATGWEEAGPSTPSYQGLHYSNPAFAFPASPARSAFGAVGGPFRGAALGRHGRTDSGNSDSSTSGFGGLSNRLPSSTEGSSSTNGFDFPASKSFAGSLRSPIRTYSDRNADYPEQWPPTPLDYPRLDVPELDPDAGDTTAGYRSGFSTPRPPTQATQGAYDQQPLSPAYKMPSTATLLRTTHGHNDSFGPNKQPSYAAASPASRYQHTQSSSFHSDSQRSNESSYKLPNVDLPPVPPLPSATDYAYVDMPVTPGGHTNQAAFQLPHALASTTSLDASDFGSPYRPAFRQLRDDTRRRLPQTGEMSSGEYGYVARPQRLQPPKGPESPVKTFSALAISMGTEGLGQLPAGIGRPDPQAPAEYALNILMSRFITLASAKTRRALESAQDQDPAVITKLVPAEEAMYEMLCESLAHIAKRNAPAVIRSLFQWKSITIEGDVGADVVRRHLGSTQANNAGTREIAMYLSRRKELVVLFLTAEVLNVVAKTMSREALGEAQAVDFEEKAFSMLLACTREKDKDQTLPRPVTVLREASFEALSQLIGELSRMRFVSVSDRFVEILESSTKAPAGKNVEDLLVAAIQSLRHLKVTVYPMELFEEGADFIYVLARHFAACHGFRVKTAFADALTHLMVPVAQSASAEVNHPTWVKAIDTIWPRMTAMAAKPRYWTVAYPLHICLLAVSPEEKLVANWFSCLELGVAKLKDRVNRSVVLNAAVRLLWAYSFRCHEGHTNTSKKLEAFFRIWFPPNRRSIHPPEASPEPFVMMIHLALYRHFEFGKDLVLNFLCHSDLEGTTLSLQPDILTGQRTTAAIRAMLLTLDAYVKGVSPVFPGGANFTRFDFDTLPPGCGDELPETFKFPKQDIADAQTQFNDLVSKIALLCDHQVSDVTVFDTRTHLFSRASVNASASASERALLERDEFALRYHQDANLTAAYSRDHQPYCDLLRACFDSWPRCISSNISFPSLLAVLFRAHFSADPDLSRASARCLQRIAKQRQGGSSTVVSGFMRWIFRMDTAFWEIHAKQTLLMPKVEQAIRFWIETLHIWLGDLQAQRNQTEQDHPGLKGIEMERTSAWALIDEVEAYALFLLCSASRTLRCLGIEILDLVARLDETFLSPSRKASLDEARLKGKEEEPSRIIHLLNLPSQTFLDANDPHLTSHQINHLAKYKSPDRTTALKQIAESEREVEQSLWSRALPLFLRMSLERFPTTVAVFRSYITNRVLEMDHVAVYAADISNRAPSNTVTSSTLSKVQASASVSSLHSSSSMASLREAAGTASPSEYTLMAQHWRFYILALCTTTTSTDGSRGGVVGNHRRKTSEPENGERMISARDLFQKMIPFLASDNDVFQEAVVFALGNTNETHYVALLETLQSVSGTLTEDFKVRSVARSGLRRNRRLDRLRTALGHVLQLTSAHMEANDHLKNPKVIMVIHTWIKETFAFLIDREIRQDWEFHRLRRYFSGVMENFFNGLVKLGVAETYFSFETRLKMFRVFRDWHSYSTMSEDGRNKLANLLSAAADQQRDDRAKERAVKTLNYETQALSYHAGCAMAALCQGVISVIGKSASAPATGSLEAGSLLSWLRSLFTTSDEKNHELARSAMRALLTFNDQNSTLISSAVDRCITEPDRVLGKRSFFVTMAEVVMEKEDFAMPLHSVFCLGLIKLSHPDTSIRRKALSMLDCSARRFNEECSLGEFEVGVSSPLPAIYLRAQREVSASLAVHFDGLKTAILSEFTQRVHSIEGIRRATTLGLLAEWLAGLELHVPSPGSSTFAKPEALYRTYLNLCNLFCLTFHYGDEHTFEMQETWCSLVTVAEDSQNVNAIIQFLINQGLRYRSPDVVLCAKRVVSCISHTLAGPGVFDELCALIEPGGMIQVPSSPPAPLPDLDHRHLYRADLGRLFPELEAGLTFSPGLLALLYVGEMTYERRDQLEGNVATLLHAIFLHIDSRSQFVRSQAVRLLEQTLRCTASMVEESVQSGSTKLDIDGLPSRRLFASWSADRADADAQHKMPRSLLSTVNDTLALVSPQFPTFQQDWGSVALMWAASNPIRHMACRSFQVFRALRPAITPTMMVTILGRLADTASDHKTELHSFTLEVLYALKLVVTTCEASNEDFLAQTWWATLACLSTINEAEFAESVAILEVLVMRLDVGSPDAISLLLQRCPEGWEGEVGLLRILVSRGLRSSATSASTFRLMAKLAKCVDTALIDVDDQSTLGYLFVAALPWFLQATEEKINAANGMSSNKSALRAAAAKKNTSEPADIPAAVLPTSECTTVFEMAADLAVIAARLGMTDLERVATSISKSRFRTKDDLVRQAVSCVRAHYLPEHGPDMGVLLLGVVLNRTEWMRRQAMQILKIFFQAMDMRNHAAFSNLGSELLMPLLRQLSTPLSSQALEVLDEPIVVHGGPAANQILRMSLLWGSAPQSSRMTEQVNDASIFGPPQESGWAVADPQDMTTQTRINLQALVKMCERTLDIVPTGNNVHFVVDDAYDGAVETEGDSNGFSVDGSADVGRSSTDDPPSSSLGDIVNQLHDLSSFFGDEPMSKSHQISVMRRDSRLDRSGSSRMRLKGSAADSNRNGDGTIGRRSNPNKASSHPPAVPDTAGNGYGRLVDGTSGGSPSRNGAPSLPAAWVSASSLNESPPAALAPSLPVAPRVAEMVSSRSHAQIAKILARSASYDLTTHSSSGTGGPNMIFTSTIPPRTHKHTGSRSSIRYRSDSVDQSSDAGSSQQHHLSSPSPSPSAQLRFKTGAPPSASELQQVSRYQG